MAKIGRRDLALLLIGIGPEGMPDSEINGITRFQKYLFLLEKEGTVSAAADGYEFTPYKAGPYSSKLYDDLELLENLGLVEGDYVADPTEEEVAEIEEFTFDELVGEESTTADNFEERRYRLTDRGLEKIRGMLSNGEFKPIVDAVRKVKSRFGNHSLPDLLYYVYTKYPEMTVASEIKDKVLRRRPKRQ